MMDRIGAHPACPTRKSDPDMPPIKKIVLWLLVIFLLYAIFVSPTEAADMIGNVWEWTRTRYRPYPYQPNDGRNDPEAEGVPVVRGGSWGDDPRNARCSVRGWYVPVDFYYDIGLRVVVSLAAAGF